MRFLIGNSAGLGEGARTVVGIVEDVADERCRHVGRFGAHPQSVPCSRVCTEESDSAHVVARCRQVEAFTLQFLMKVFTPLRVPQIGIWQQHATLSSLKGPSLRGASKAPPVVNFYCGGDVGDARSVSMAPQSGWSLRTELVPLSGARSTRV